MGHDFLDKCGGEGAFSVWRHNMKNLDFINHKVTPDTAGQQ